MARLDTTVALGMVEREALAQGVPPDVARAILLTENTGKNGVVPVLDTETRSPKDAMGFMQVIPSTFQGLKRLGFLPPDATYDTPQAQVKAGVAAIKERMSAGISNPVELAVSFNGSPAVLESYRQGKPIPQETVNYINTFQKHLGGAPMATSERVSTKVIPPDVENGIAMSADRMSSMADDFMLSVADLSNQITGNTAKQATAIRAAGAAGAAAKTAAGEVDAGTIDSRQRLLSAFGINLDSTDPREKRVLQENLDAVIASQEARKPLVDQISQLQSANPLKDPIGWLMGNFKAEGLKPQYNALVMKENAAAENLRSVQQIATSQAAIQPANIAESIKLKAYAEAKLAQASAEADVAKVEGAALQTIARNSIEAVHIAGGDLSQRLAMANLLVQKYSFGASTNEKEAEANKSLEPINAMRMTVGLDPIDITRMRLMRGKEKELWSEVGSNQRWGSDLAESVSNLHNFLGDVGIQKLMTTNAPLGEFLKVAVQGGKAELEAIRNNERVKGLADPRLKGVHDPEDQLRVGVKIWQEKIDAERMYRDNSRMTAENPYKLDNARAMNLPDLADNSTAKFIGKYAADNKGSLAGVTDNLLWEHAVAESLNNPALVPKMAADLSTYYRVGTASKTMSLGMSQLGLEAAKEYPVKVNNTVVDMLNPTVVENYLTQLTARRIFQNSAAGINTFQRPMN